MPKRGVLLHGVPGTGKTSIGRALAHRMKGRFFLIDGTVASEPAGEFYKRIDRIFVAAVRNSPAVIFIDDADVLFKTDHVFGLNRYLLTKLDGLISENINNVCVMMTAMNVSDLPAALLRSGRLDVWLEVKVPDAATRREILLHYSRNLPEQYRDFDKEVLAEACEGFTPADLRRLMGDAAALLAYDIFRNKEPESFGHYLASAIDALRALKIIVAKATGQQQPALAQAPSVTPAEGRNGGL
jgi:SpoVK/Ycf46/Vps4 family AAA+-type ATPase